MSPLIDLLTKRQAIEPGTHDVIIDGYIHYCVAGSYDYEICDFCGRKRKCDWWASDMLLCPDAPTGWDACRQCSKKFKQRGEE